MTVHNLHAPRATVRRTPALAVFAMIMVVLARPSAAVQPLTVAPATEDTGQVKDLTLAEYRTHLTALAAIVDACTKARDTQQCDPALVGSDDRVPLSDAANAERRPVRYDWLRALLTKASKPDEKPQQKPKSVADFHLGPAPINPRPPLPTTSELLDSAKARLATDLAQIDSEAVPNAAHAAERDAMKNVLAGRDFRNLEEVKPQNTYLEKFGDWLNKIFGAIATATSGAAWVGRLVEIGFFVAVCVGLAWGLIQFERRWRVRLTPESDRPAPGAASARDWQLWLGDARKAASAGLWREAIHFVYWAAISRLESKRLWPADRARTPREYLALVGADDARKPGLASLTGSFERTWYGGREAGEADYRRAEELATALISGNTGTAEGGAQ